jgi:hypothetical protein
LKKIIKRAALILTFVMICCVSYGSLSVSAAEDFNDMGTRAISDVNKIWTLKFRTPVDINSLNSSVGMKDLTDGSTVNINISAGDDENSVKVNPPSGGYKLSHNYKLTIDKSTKSKKREVLPKSAVLNFSLTSKDNNSYNASANVVVSPGLPMFKQITISTNLPSVSKYKIEGNNNLFSVGSTAVSLVSQTAIKVSLYDNKENLLGTSTLDVSSTKNNISMNITLAN